MKEETEMLRLMITVFFFLLSTATILSAQGFLPFSNGTVVQVSGKDTLYYVINGNAAHIPSPAVFQCLQLDRNKKAMITKERLDALPKTDFVIEGGDGKIYKVDGDRKRHITSPGTLKRLGISDSVIINVSPNMANCIPDGPPIN